jgi:hypothetical protein
MKKRWILLTALLGGAIGLAQQVPLSWFAGENLTLADPNARALGTVWDGHIAHIEGLPPIATQLEGRKIVLAADGAQLKMTGVAEPGRLSDIALNLPIRSLARFDPRLAGLNGEIDLRLDELLIEGNACTQASGSAMTDVLALNAATWQWAGPEMQGPIACEEGAVVITMEGADASGTVDVRIAISPSGPYRTDVNLYTPDPNAAAILPLFGFERGAGDTYRISESGAWQ